MLQRHRLLSTALHCSPTTTALHCSPTALLHCSPARHCLQVYPDCELTITDPVCYRVNLNIGLVRILP